MIEVKNNTQKVMGFGGARIPPGEKSLVKSSEKDAREHVFFKTGELSIVNTAGGGNVGQGKRPNANEAIAEIAASEDPSYLREMEQDERKSVAKAALDRVQTLLDAGVLTQDEDGELVPAEEDDGSGDEGGGE